MARKPTSQLLDCSAPNALPAVANGNSSTGTPRRPASSRAKSTDTPPSAPVAGSCWARTMLPRLIVARRRPVGASSRIAAAGTWSMSYNPLFCSAPLSNGVLEHDANGAPRLHDVFGWRNLAGRAINVEFNDGVAFLIGNEHEAPAWIEREEARRLAFGASVIHRGQRPLSRSTESTATESNPRFE